VSIRILLRYVARYRARYLAGFALLLATTLCALAIPWVIKLTIEAIGSAIGPARTAVGLGALAIVGLALLQGVARSASRLALLGASQRVEADIRNDLFRRLLRLP